MAPGHHNRMTERPHRWQLKTPKRGAIPWKIVAAGVVAVAGLIAVAVPLYATNEPSFYGRYQHFEERYQAWKTSSHRTVSCIQCHVGPADSVGYRASLVREFYTVRGKVRRPAVAGLPPASAAACRQCHKDERTQDLKRLSQIPHPAHPDLAAETRDCVKCHKWVAHSEKYQERHKKIAFTGICMSFGCHAGTKKSTECRFCHHVQSFAAPKWRTLHPRIVQTRGENGCFDYCHKPKQCRTCHQTGKNPFEQKGSAPKQLTSLIAQHELPTWDAQHGKEAQIDEQRCFYCHGSEAACKDCHSRRPAFHGPKSTWLARHQKIGKKTARCLACHAKKDCDDCHRVFKEER